MKEIAFSRERRQREKWMQQIKEFLEKQLYVGERSDVI